MAVKSTTWAVKEGVLIIGTTYPKGSYMNNGLFHHCLPWKGLHITLATGQATSERGR